MFVQMTYSRPVTAVASMMRFRSLKPAYFHMPPYRRRMTKTSTQIPV